MNNQKWFKPHMIIRYSIIEYVIKKYPEFTS